VLAFAVLGDPFLSRGNEARSQMHIARAYCVDASKIVDIYQARALFYGQDEPRRRFEFLCSDDACRSANATRVTGVNYDKLVEEGHCVAIRPHFRRNPDSSHIDVCEWVLRERSFEALDSESREEGRGPRRVRSFRNVKAGDLVDLFLVNPATPLGTPQREAGAAASGSVESKRRSVRNGRQRHTRADFLETVTSVYELLEPGERREATLRIGRGPALSYQTAFCRIEYYLGVSGRRIFHGGVRVQRHGPNFVVRFFDRVRPYQAGSDVSRAVSLYLKRNMLQEHWNGRFLAAQLTEAARPGRYAHCYFFGRLVSHPTHAHRFVVNVDSLDHLAFAVRSVKPH